MSKEKVFFNLVELSGEFFDNCRDKGPDFNAKYFNTAALMAHAQQLAVISGHLGRIAACLEKLTGKVEELPDAPTT